METMSGKLKPSHRRRSTFILHFRSPRLGCAAGSISFGFASTRMFIRLAVFLCAVSPKLRRLLWRWWYGRLARKFRTSNWTFMNYGLVPPEGVRLQLESQDEPDRLCIQLYARVVSPVPLRGAQVLEVGSGRGGGASYVARYHAPARITGVDFSVPAVAWCRQQHAAVPNLAFRQGDAEALPFGDGSFDAVLNVESSHCYGQIGKFFREAARMLRPGGHFLYADFRSAKDMPALEAQLAAETAWRQVAREDITAAVFAALAADDARKRRLIEEGIPPRMRATFGEFAGLAGSEMFEAFRQREVLYYRFVYRKGSV